MKTVVVAQYIVANVFDVFESSEKKEALTRIGYIL